MSELCDTRQFSRTLLEVHTNGERLAYEARDLFEMDRFASAYVLAVLAQEELAKLFLLSLVRAGALPWSSELRKVLRNHACKHLAGAILVYLLPEHEVVVQRFKREVGAPIVVPALVLDAIQILVRLKLAPPNVIPNYEPEDKVAIALAKGYFDTKKQNALYVDIGRNGQVASTPTWVTPEVARAEVESAVRIAGEMRGYEGDPGSSSLNGLEGVKLVVIFKVLTGAMSREEYRAHWVSRM